jgi:transketolase
VRNAFVQTLVEMADADDSVVLLTGDLGFTVLEPFADRYPDRFYNVGVAEQNMVGVATGLASCGFTPFVYSIATFASMRPYEFFRNGAVLHELPVRVVGVGGGVDYGTNGVTHHALEDIALMRAQPGLAVLAPADAEQTRAVVLASKDLAGPAYLRLGKGGAAVPGLGGRFRLGRLELVGDGTDVAIVSYGASSADAVEAADLLEHEGLAATVAVAASLAPPPTTDLVELLERVPLAIALESHYVNGGVGSLVAETVAEHGLGCRVVRRAIEEMPRGDSGSPRYLAARHGLTAGDVADEALRLLQSRL